MDAEHATEGRLVTPNTSASLSVHVVASPASHGALEGGGLSVRSFVVVNYEPSHPRTVAAAGSPLWLWLSTKGHLGRRGPRLDGEAPIRPEHLSRSSERGPLGGPRSVRPQSAGRYTTG